VAVEEHLADPGFTRNLFQVGGFEATASEGTSRRRKQLVSAIQAA
jgi:hypothetical protein